MHKNIQKNKSALKTGVFFKISLLLVLLLTIKFDLKAQTTGAVGIGTTTPNASSVLDITSSTKGLLIPRLTTTERDAIGSPANGLLIYNTSSSKFNYWDGAKWAEVGQSIVWFTGQGSPPGAGNAGADVSKLNDLYLDVLTRDIYQREISSLSPLVLVWKRIPFKSVNKQAFTLTGTIAPTGFSIQKFTFTDVSTGNDNAVLCSPKFNLPDGIIISHAWVSGTNEVSVKLYNVTGASISTAGAYEIAVF